MLPPSTTPSSLYVSLIVCELLFNIVPSIIVLVYRSPNTPSLGNIYLICTPEAINSCRSNCAVLGDFNCPKFNWVSNTAPPKTVDSQLLSFCSDSLLRQCILTPTRFLVNQHPSPLDLIFVKFPHLISPISIHSPLGKSDHAVLCLCSPPTTSPSR